MKVWMKIDSVSSPSTGITDGFLSKLMATTESGNRNIATMTQESDEMLGGLLSMESHLAASLVVGSSVEYKYWLLTYTRYLSSEADVNRLTELCKSLLGPPTGKTGPAPTPAQGKNWEPSILGMAKRELLRELLPIMSTNRSLQRLVAQFREGLESISK
eukprot:Phypoly_transcript_19179.p1 GENE.Phypoly_transcript_19179~~Phypoly_transcript_19179.p1  ORF type:complete len:159 (+),score=21.60 Phypoly_transcript_19179:171-647(+)